jgi:cyclopropane-fatty-acyl-phospholipid synthase
MDPVSVACRLFDSPSRPFAVHLWNDADLPAAREAGVRGRLALRHPRALDAFFPVPTERRLAEAYLDGLLDLEGDAVALVESAARWEGPRRPIALAPHALAVALGRLVRPSGPAAAAAALHGRKHSVERDRDAVRHHYDVSDDFYRLFLDEAMVYSCAYFPRGGESLEEAQRAKLDLVCRKLSLAPGERLLDVGCGWGALVEHAAAGYGVSALGITLSENQLAEARRRAAGPGPGGRVEIAPADYRTLRAGAPFDKVASVGMMEHVGLSRLGDYFATVHRLLRPGGLFLNHAIADTSGGVETIPWAGRRGGGFIARYIFPDGELLPIHEVVRAAERAGFEVRDLESLPEHYAETLQIWLGRLEARFDEAVALAGERRARAYRLYLASSAAAFRLGRNGLFQLLLAKRSPSARREGSPRCRAEWYARPGSAPPGARERPTWTGAGSAAADGSKEPAGGRAAPSVTGAVTPEALG